MALVEGEGGMGCSKCLCYGNMARRGYGEAGRGCACAHVGSGEGVCVRARVCMRVCVRVRGCVRVRARTPRRCSQRTWCTGPLPSPRPGPPHPAWDQVHVCVRVREGAPPSAHRGVVVDGGGEGRHAVNGDALLVPHQVVVPGRVWVWVWLGVCVWCVCVGGEGIPGPQGITQGRGGEVVAGKRVSRTRSSYLAGEGGGGRGSTGPQGSVGAGGRGGGGEGQGEGATGRAWQLPRSGGGGGAGGLPCAVVCAWQAARSRGLGLCVCVCVWRCEGGRGQPHPTGARPQ